MVTPAYFFRFPIRKYLLDSGGDCACTLLDRQTTKETTNKRTEAQLELIRHDFVIFSGPA